MRAGARGVTDPEEVEELGSSQRHAPAHGKAHVHHFPGLHDSVRVSPHGADRVEGRGCRLTSCCHGERVTGSCPPVYVPDPQSVPLRPAIYPPVTRDLSP